MIPTNDNDPSLYLSFVSPFSSVPQCIYINYYLPTYLPFHLCVEVGMVLACPFLIFIIFHNSIGLGS